MRRRGADSSGAKRRVGQRGEVRVVATQLGVDGLGCPGVQRGLKGACRILDIEPRPGVSVDIPPRRRTVGNITRDG